MYGLKQGSVSNIDTKYKWSNCLIESIRTFLKNPFDISIKRKGSWKLILNRNQFPHFYWYVKSEEKYYHFCARYSDEPLLSQLWFQGRIEEFYYYRKER